MSEQTAKPPVFLLGSQRSGTTMLRLMLNNHPSLSIPHESAFITICFRRLSQHGDLGQKDTARNLLPDVMRHPLVRRGQLVANHAPTLSPPIRDSRDLLVPTFRAHHDHPDHNPWGH